MTENKNKQRNDIYSMEDFAEACYGNKLTSVESK